MSATETIIDAINELDARKAQMPARCPKWCVGTHLEAIDEGCDVESARVHQSADLGGRGYRVQLFQDHLPHGPWAGTEIEVEITRREPDRADGSPKFTVARLRMSTGEARGMAAQLLRLADAEDFRGL
jgi:hypothetical protein